MRLRPMRMASMASGIPWPRIFGAVARHEADDQPAAHRHEHRPHAKLVGRRRHEGMRQTMCRRDW